MQELVIPYKIGDYFVRLHSDWIFLYGNDELEKGALGQAWFLKGYANTFRIPTLHRYCSNPAHWQGMQEGSIAIDKAISILPKGKIIIPCRKIGEGGSRLKELNRQLFDYMNAELKKIAYPNIRWDYTKLWRID